MNRSRPGATIFIGIFAISISLMFWFLARHMPLRYLVWLCLLTATYAVLEITLRKSFSERINQNRFLGIVLELVLGAIFVAAFYCFAVYVYPGTR
jgi:RsiW-degrading membrane proteinase PrsW (M82 family)